MVFVLHYSIWNTAQTLCSKYTIVQCQDIIGGFQSKSTILVLEGFMTTFNCVTPDFFLFVFFLCVIFHFYIQYGHYTHYIGIFPSGYIYLFIELIPTGISQVPIYSRFHGEFMYKCTCKALLKLLLFFFIVYFSSIIHGLIHFNNSNCYFIGHIKYPNAVSSS